MAERTADYGHGGYWPSCPLPLANMLVEIVEHLEHNGTPYQDVLPQTVWILRVFERHLIRRRRFLLAFDLAWVIHRIHEAGSIAAVQVQLQRGMAAPGR